LDSSLVSNENLAKYLHLVVGP